MKMSCVMTNRIITEDKDLSEAFEMNTLGVLKAVKCQGGRFSPTTLALNPFICMRIQRG